MKTCDWCGVVRIVLCLFHAVLGLPLSNGSNVTAGLLQLDGSVGRYQCVNDERWSTTYFHPRDCNSAIQSLFENEVQLWGRITFEFLASATTPTTRAQWQRTPRRYSAGTCTLAIALQQDLQGVFALERYVDRDFGDYWDFWKQAKTLRQDCLPPYLALNESEPTETEANSPNFRSSTGWALVVSPRGLDTASLELTLVLQGSQSGIVVLLYETGSWIDISLPRVSQEWSITSD